MNYRANLFPIFYRHFENVCVIMCDTEERGSASQRFPQTADKPQMRRKYLPSPVRGRGTAASAVVDEVAKNSIST